MEELQIQLNEAKAALHKLIIGEKAVEVTKSDGSKAKFTPAKIEQLRAYIASLEAEINGTTTVRKAIGIRF